MADNIMIRKYIIFYRSSNFVKNGFRDVFCKTEAVKSRINVTVDGETIAYELEFLGTGPKNGAKKCHFRFDYFKLS